MSGPIEKTFIIQDHKDVQDACDFTGYMAGRVNVDAERVAVIRGASDAELLRRPEREDAQRVPLLTYLADWSDCILAVRPVSSVVS